MSPAVRNAIASIAVLVIAGSAKSAMASSGLDDRIEKFSRLLQKDPSFRIRALAAKKLAELAHEGARSNQKIVDALTACLADDNALVRGICIKGLVTHRAHASVGRLTYVARFDPEDAVKNAAEDAIAELKRQASLRPTPPVHRPRKQGPLTVSIGKVEVERSPGVSTRVAKLLEQIVRDSIEDQIEPHKPAIFPREDPDLRLDVTIACRMGEGQNLQVEVRVVLVEIPGAHLRHASRATARTNAARKSKEIERQLAIKAASRAVSDALALVYGG